MLADELKHSVSQLKQQKPLVLCLTNHVTMDFVANGLLALGAAPLMTESTNELSELISLSQAVYINMGTLNNDFIKRALLAIEIATAANKPIVLDPVGSGASTLRTTTALNLLPLTSIIRGNASEIISLSGILGSSKGVESVASVEQAMEIAQSLALQYNKTILLSGPRDFITDGKRSCTLSYGSALMPLVTGMGCTLTGVLSAFAACNSDYFQAAQHAAAYFSLCGQSAQILSKGPGTFKSQFIDALYYPEWETIRGFMQQEPCHYAV